MFKGDFECTELILLHSRFNIGTNIVTCNNGSVLGRSLTVDSSSNCYTSLLCIMVIPYMAGKTIVCIYDNGTDTKVVGNYSIPPNTTATSFIGNLLIHIYVTIHILSKLPSLHAATSASMQEAENITSDSTHTQFQGIQNIMFPYYIIMSGYCVIVQWCVQGGVEGAQAPPLARKNY